MKHTFPEFALATLVALGGCGGGGGYGGPPVANAPPAAVVVAGHGVARP